jgi:hypothetical protein
LRTALIAEAGRLAAGRGFARIETGCRYLDRYEVVDAVAVRHVITESRRSW